MQHRFVGIFPIQSTKLYFRREEKAFVEISLEISLEILCLLGHIIIVM